MTPLEITIVAAALVALLVVVRRGRPVKDGLDTVLYWWNEVDGFTRRHLLSAGVLIFGRPGSGKTSGSGLSLANAIVADPQATVLILASKPEDADMWRAIFKLKNRQLLEFSPNSRLRCNLIEFIEKMGGDTREIVNFLLTAAEVLRTETGGNGENGAFFDDAKRRFLHHAVEVLRQAGVPVTVPNIQSFINSAALSKEQMRSDVWKEQFHYQALHTALEKEKSKTQKDDFELAAKAWLEEWPAMSDKTRSSILSCMLNVLFYFNTGIVRELISTDTNCSPFDLLNGDSILVNWAPCEWGLSGALGSSAWKYATQKLILSRSYKPDDYYTIIWADECYQFTTSFDQQYAAQSRSHGGAMVYLAQSLESFYAALKGQDGMHFANGLISMFSHRIFHAVGSPMDAQYASALLGTHRETSFSGSMHPPKDAFDATFGHLFGAQQCHSSFNESWQPVLQPGAFYHLRCGGEENNYLVDGIVVRSGEPFSSGSNWICATFSQR